MPIPPAHSARYAYHFTHLDNLPGLLRDGFFSKNQQNARGVVHRSIAAAGIQETRARTVVTCGPGGTVHDYVPFYFCKRSSMLLGVVNKKNVDQQFLIYFAFPIALVEQSHVVFTNASANTHSPPNFYSSADDLTQLNWTAIDDRTWSLGEQLNQARMAELLVRDHVDIRTASFIVVWNSDVARFVRDTYAAAGVTPPPIREDSFHYFTKYPADVTASLVTGPYWTHRQYQDFVGYITQHIGSASTPRFASPSQLLAALDQFGLACLPETAELINLSSANEMHKEDVGTHTLKVVTALRSSREYLALTTNDQGLVSLAAYLHDIGKGPKSRWPDGIQKVDPDHPIGSALMLKRILTQEVAAMKPRSVRALVKLVCYHDIVGDIVGKGRDVQQLVRIADNERELEMIIALGKADMGSVQPTWGLYGNQISDLKKQVLAALTVQDTMLYEEEPT
jgi:hypothetical protein